MNPPAGSPVTDAPPTAGRSRRSRRYRLTRRGRIVFTALPLFVAAGVLTPLLIGPPPTLDVSGITDGQAVGTEVSTLEARMASDQAIPAGTLAVTLDGSAVEPRFDDPTTGTIDLSGLSDGPHTLVVAFDRGVFHEPLVVTRSFVVDTTPPAITVDSPTAPVPVGDAVVIAGRTDDPGATITIDGNEVPVAADGAFSTVYDEVPDTPVAIVATDALGNEAGTTVSVELALAGSPGGPPMRGVHATGYTWVTPVLREPIMQMIAEGRINTVELDLKDEAGHVWYDTSVRLAHEAGAVIELYDLAAAVDELHALGIRVVGRIVNFRDPVLADHAVEHGLMDWVVQTPDGEPFGKYGGFTNPFHPDVWEYNIALAEEAARLGVDDILYDYVRRPDEDLSRMAFPGQDGPPEDAIVGFLAASRERVHAAGARLGASVFGVAARRPGDVAQDIPRMAEQVDYLAPMLYPSHWGPNEYGVPDPNAAPYDIVHLSLLDFQEQVAGTGATLVSWLQDFSLGRDYGVEEVRAQIQASIDAGVPDFLLWDAATTYTADALDPTP